MGRRHAARPLGSPVPGRDVIRLDSIRTALDRYVSAGDSFGYARRALEDVAFVESELSRLRSENGLLRSTLRDIELRAQYAHETTARKEP